MAFIYLVFVNITAYALFEMDKSSAQMKRWRVSEQKLLFVALIGGALGSKFAQKSLRHKTTKEPFRSQLQVRLYSQFIVIPVIFIAAVQLAPILIIVFQ